MWVTLFPPVFILLCMEEHARQEVDYLVRGYRIP